jgi:hypothetical protein
MLLALFFLLAEKFSKTDGFQIMAKDNYFFPAGAGMINRVCFYCEPSTYLGLVYRACLNEILILMNLSGVSHTLLISDSWSL